MRHRLHSMVVHVQQQTNAPLIFMTAAAPYATWEGASLRDSIPTGQGSRHHQCCCMCAPEHAWHTFVRTCQ